MAFLEYWELVDDSGDNGLDHRELTVDAQREQHDEEQDRPERRGRHHCYSLRVRDERQARSCESTNQSITEDSYNELYI